MGNAFIQGGDIVVGVIVRHMGGFAVPGGHVCSVGRRCSEDPPKLIGGMPSLNLLRHTPQPHPHLILSPVRHWGLRPLPSSRAHTYPHTSTYQALGFATSSLFKGPSPASEQPLHILDLGARTGFSTAYLATTFPKAQVRLGLRFLRFRA